MGTSSADVLARAVVSENKTLLVQADGEEKPGCWLYVEGGERYKLRECVSEEEAARLAVVLRRVAPLEVVPPFLARQGRYVLLPFVEGKELPRAATPEECRTLGEMAARINSLTVEPFDVAARLREDLARLEARGWLTPALVRRCREGFARLCPERLEFALDYRDFRPANVIRTATGLKIIDEETIGANLRAIGCAKPFRYWFTPVQREAFVSGYNAVGDFAVYVRNVPFYHLVYFARWLRTSTEKPIASVRSHAEKLEMMLEAVGAGSGPGAWWTRRRFKRRLRREKRRQRRGGRGR